MMTKGDGHFSLLSIFILFLLSLRQAQSDPDPGSPAYDDYNDAYDAYDEEKVLAAGPSFDVPIVNVTVVAGQTAVLPCSINKIGDYKVAWINQDWKTFTYQHERVIDDNRVSILRPYDEEWNLQIWNVKYADQGEYRCTLNTNPVKSKIVFLYVKVPSKIIDELSSNDVTVEEGETVVLVCNVTGVPPPKVTWYRKKSRASIPRESTCGSLNEIGTTGEMIKIFNVSRFCDDEYECVAYNDVKPAVSRTIRVTVEFKPEIHLPNKRIIQGIGKFTILVCQITAYPLSEMYWERNGKRVSNSEKHRIDNFDEGEHIVMFNLQIHDIQREDYGAYKCVAINKLGRDEKIMSLDEHFPTTPAVTTEPAGYEEERKSTESVDVKGIVRYTTSKPKPPRKGNHKRPTDSPAGNREKNHKGKAGVADKVTLNGSQSTHRSKVSALWCLTIALTLLRPLFV